MISRFFENQIQQLVILAILFVSALSVYDLWMVPPGEWFGLSTKQWFLVAITSPVIHQIYVWLCWRGELYFKTLTKNFGDKAYSIFSIFFGILIFVRFFSIIAVCIADYQSLSLSSAVRYPLAFILHLPAIYAIYSVVRYFGVARVPGEGHFRPEEYKNTSRW